MQNPVTLILRALGLWLEGWVHLCCNLENERPEDCGEGFVTFRKVIVDPAADQPVRPGATFRVRFRFKNLPARANRLMSLMPIPMIVAQASARKPGCSDSRQATSSGTTSSTRWRRLRRTGTPCHCG